MPAQVLMPQLGESVNEGTITKWLKAPGERVEQYEPLVEINTDKVDTEIPCPASGTLLEIRLPAGSVARVGMLLALIARPDEAPDLTLGEQPGVSVHPSINATAGASDPGPRSPKVGEGLGVREKVSPGRHAGLGFVSPLVARIATAHQIDLSALQGSGQGGRITKGDIEAYLARPPFPVSEPTPAPTAAISPVPATLPAAAALPGDLLPLTTLRRAIAEHMVISKHTSPHVSTFMEVDLSRVAAHHQANRQVFARDGLHLTFTAYFILAAATALKAFPIVNSSWSEAGIRLHRVINIGMATSLGEAGLIVPVIKNAGDLSLLDIARAVNDLAERARLRKLLPDEVQGGTFTITNHGVSGSLFATPIINQPQCAILGVGAIQKRPVVLSDPNLGDVIAIRPMAYLGLTFDHRILDGASADHFLARLVETLQDWS